MGFAQKTKNIKKGILKGVSVVRKIGRGLRKGYSVVRKGYGVAKKGAGVAKKVGQITYDVAKKTYGAAKKTYNAAQKTYNFLKQPIKKAFQTGKYVVGQAGKAVKKLYAAKQLIKKALKTPQLMTIAVILDSNKPLKYKKMLIDTYIEELQRQKLLPLHIIKDLKSALIARAVSMSKQGKQQEEQEMIKTIQQTQQQLKNSLIKAQELKKSVLQNKKENQMIESQIIQVPLSMRKTRKRK